MLVCIYKNVVLPLNVCVTTRAYTGVTCSHAVQFQSQEVGTHISAKWIIAVHMIVVYEFQSKIKEE